MKYQKKDRRAILLAAVVALSATFTYAQDDAEPVFELSPFEVDASGDTGYRATNTLAGSRLNTQLKDVAASVTVLTGEFLDDLGADDIETALAYVAGAETGQTFLAGSQTSDYIQGVSGSPATNRLRGLSQADVTADFFGVTNSNLDRYNIERIAIVRGPNSVLFGLGSPSGIINYNTKKASVQRNFNEIRFTVTDQDTVRGEFDVNRVLMEDKLAVRVMGMYEDTRYPFEYAFDRDKRATIAATYRPTDKTSIQFRYEDIDNKSRRPRWIPPADNITRWVDGGSPTHDPFNNPGVNPGDFFGDLVGNGTNPAQFFTNMSVPGSDFALSLENRRPNDTRLPSSQRVQFRRSSNPDRSTNYFVNPTVTDKNVFPYDKYDINAMPGSWQTQFANTKTVILNHAFTDNFNVEIGYHDDITTNDSHNQFIDQSNSIQIDPNITLPNGDTNPNFLRPFIFGRGVGRFREESSESFRVQASYELDFAEVSDNNFLGKHRLSALFTDSTFTEFTYAWEQRISAVNHPGWTGDRTLLDDSSRRAHAVVYVGDPLQPGQMYPNYTGFPETELFRTGELFAYEFYDPEAGEGGAWVEGPEVALERMVHRNAGWNIRDTEGIGFALQSFFWNDKIVTTLGWRDDEVTGRSTSFPTPGSDGLYTLDRDQWTLGDPGTASDSTVTTGAVYHATDWLSFHWNESENFVVSPPQVDILGRDIPSSSGIGEDYGFSLNLLDQKMNVKFNWFETTQKNSSDGGLGFVGFWRMRGFERGIFDRIDNETITGVDWVRWDGSTEQYERFPNVGDVRDFKARGMEVEVTYNPTANWRVAFNASKQETVQDNTGLAMLEYIELRQPFWDQIWDQEWSSTRTVGEQFVSSVGSRLFPALAANGRISIDQAKWSWNAVTNYRFNEGRFKGVSAGASMRWTDNRAIGYALTTDADGNDITDLDSPFFGPDNLNVGVHAAFGKKIFNDSVDWRIQLNVQNLMGDSSLVPVRINPDGNTASHRIGRPTMLRLTNTFKF
jgi:outer membrane receptor protein involved in Fe transport